MRSSEASTRLTFSGVKLSAMSSQSRTTAWQSSDRHNQGRAEDENDEPKKAVCDEVWGLKDAATDSHNCHAISSPVACLTAEDPEGRVFHT